MHPELSSTAAEAPPWVVRAEGVVKAEMFPGFWRQTLLSGEQLMLCLFTWRQGASLPEHHHYHEQAGYVISGAVELEVGGRKTVTQAGDSYFIASDVPHAARALEDSLVLDAFSPPRTEYLPAGEKVHPPF